MDRSEVIKLMKKIDINNIKPYWDDDWHKYLCYHHEDVVIIDDADADGHKCYTVDFFDTNTKDWFTAWEIYPDALLPDSIFVPDDRSYFLHYVEGVKKELTPTLSEKNLSDNKLGDWLAEKYRVRAVQFEHGLDLYYGMSEREAIDELVNEGIDLEQIGPEMIAEKMKIK